MYNKKTPVGFNNSQGKVNGRRGEFSGVRTNTHPVEHGWTVGKAPGKKLALEDKNKTGSFS